MTEPDKKFPQLFQFVRLLCLQFFNFRKLFISSDVKFGYFFIMTEPDKKNKVEEFETISNTVKLQKKVFAACEDLDGHAESIGEEIFNSMLALYAFPDFYYSGYRFPDNGIHYHQTV